MKKSGTWIWHSGNTSDTYQSMKTKLAMKLTYLEELDAFRVEMALDKTPFLFVVRRGDDLEMLASILGMASTINPPAKNFSVSLQMTDYADERRNFDAKEGSE